MEITKEKITFGADDWLSGLDPQFDASGLAQINKQLPQSRSMNPYRYLGLLAPGFMPTDVANVSIVDTVLRKGVVNGANAYVISTGDGASLPAQLHKIETLTGTPSLVTPTTFPHPISHAHTGEIGSDLVLYTAKVATVSARRLFYSFYDGTDWDIGTYDLSTTFDDDFMSTAPATPLASPYLTGGAGFPHPLIVGDDDILYVGDRNFLHAYDGQNSADDDGKFFPAVLTLPGNYVITSFAKYNQYLVVFAYLNDSTTNALAGEARAFFWDYLSLDISYAKNLNDWQVSEAFEFKGTIGCFTQGRPGDQASVNSKVSKLLLFNGAEFEPIAQFDKNIPIRGGVDIKGNDIYWNSQGTVYQWDSQNKILNSPGEGSGTTTGMLATLNRTQFISSGTTTSGGLQTLSTNYYFQTLVYSGMAKPNFGEYWKARIKRVRVKFGKTSTGGRAVTIKFRDRFNDFSTIIASTSTIDSTNVIKEYDVDTSGAPLGVFDVLRCVVEYGSGAGATDAPIIDTIEVFYEGINV